jgi:hypothetical protein
MESLGEQTALRNVGNADPYTAAELMTFVCRVPQNFRELYMTYYFRDETCLNPENNLIKIKGFDTYTEKK